MDSLIRQLILIAILTGLATSAVGQDSVPFALVVLPPAHSSLAPSDAARLTNAQAWASTEASRNQARRLRWNLVAINEPLSLVDIEADTAQPLVRITVFPGISFVAKHTRHRVLKRASSVSWTGEILQGGSGAVEIRLVPDNDGQPVAFINIRSDLGDFNIWPTVVRPYAIASKSKREFQEPTPAAYN